MHAVILDYFWKVIYIYIRNNIGPNTLPCGIPLVTLAEKEHFPVFQKFLYPAVYFPSDAISPKFFSKHLCGTLSKAFLKSR